MKIQLKDLNEEIMKLQNELAVENELKQKKKRAQQNRKKAQNRLEVSKSVSIEKAMHPSLKVKEDTAEDPYMVQDKPKAKVADLSKFLSKANTGKS